MTGTRRGALIAMALAALAWTVPAAAQDWPTKPIRLVVTFAPGGSSDVVARALSVPLSQRLGQPVVVENKPGAGGTIAGAEVARAAPDGYTLLMSNTQPISLSPFMLDQAPYDPVRSFTHVSLVATVPDVVMVHPSVPVRTLPELVAWIRAQPGQVFFGSGGIGSIGHVLGETLKKHESLPIEHVGYKGSGPMIIDLMAGRLSFSIDTLPQNVPHIRAEKLRPLAVTGRDRSAIAADIPTVFEAGQPTLVAENFIGVSAPAGLPEAVTTRLHAAIQAALDDPAFVARLGDLGLTVRRMSQPDFARFVEAQVGGWAEPVRASGAKLN